jgi:hypothetical protein
MFIIYTSALCRTSSMELADKKIFDVSECDAIYFSLE